MHRLLATGAGARPANLRSPTQVSKRPARSTEATLPPGAGRWDVSSRPGTVARPQQQLARRLERGARPQGLGSGSPRPPRPGDWTAPAARVDRSTARCVGCRHRRLGLQVRQCCVPPPGPQLSGSSLPLHTVWPSHPPPSVSSSRLHWPRSLFPPPGRDWTQRHSPCVRAGLPPRLGAPVPGCGQDGGVRGQRRQQWGPRGSAARRWRSGGWHGLGPGRRCLPR